MEKVGMFWGSKYTWDPISRHEEEDRQLLPDGGGGKTRRKSANPRKLKFLKIRSNKTRRKKVKRNKGV